MTGGRATASFDPAGPLPRSFTVLEASAGTGKTYTIEGLVTRYVVAGHPLSGILVVTFTRAATAELRERIRTRLLRTAEALEAGADSDDPVVVEVRRGGVAAAVERLHAALADFDAATIATIHGFCQHVLGGLGLAGDADRHAQLLEDERDLLEGVIADLWVRHFAGADEEPPLTLRQLGEVVRRVVSNPGAVLLPEGSEDPVVRLRVRLAEEALREVRLRKRALGVLSYDDVLTRLADTLQTGAGAEEAKRRLQQQYGVALIDEFQDTDPVQWSIVERAFGDLPLILIGDPKQAIYAFRGADVNAYRTAARRASSTATLQTNWRSDPALLEGLNTLFDGAMFGRDIAYLPVTAPAGRPARRLVGDVGAPLQVRWLPRHEDLPATGRALLADPARDHVARDLAARAAQLLGSGATLLERDEDGVERQVPVGPPHIAVLLRRNADAAVVQRHLRDVGIPSVVNGVGSVFATEAAAEWGRLLEVLERPASPGRVHAVALSSFFGWSAAEVAHAPDARWDALHQRVHELAALVRERSVTALVQELLAHERLAQRLMAIRGGERLLTDLLHIGELLAAASTDALGPAALAAWLAQRIDANEDEAQSEDRARRLESDADAVQIMTVHRSKGLEFPIVLLPFAWAASRVDAAVPVFHDAERDRRAVDVGGTGAPQFDEHKADATAEQRWEELRTLYVAMTRAKHQLVVWWAPCNRYAALGKLLFCRRQDGSVNTQATPSSVFADAVVRDMLEGIATRAPDAIAVAAVPATVDAGPWTPTKAGPEGLDRARFERGIDLLWRRTSYSALVRQHDAHDVGERVVDDEEEGAGPDVTAAGPIEGAVAQPALFGGIRGGVEFGTFAHAVLEVVDFAAVDLDGELRAAIIEQRRRSQLDVGDLDALVADLRRVIATPLGALTDGRPLRAFDLRDRLNELDFELPLGSHGSGAAIASIADLLRRHEAGGPLDGYAERLDAPTFRTALRGYLAGSLDLVLRVPVEHGHRYAVIDHKTNRLGPREEPLTAWHYRPSALAAAMQDAHYPLQALLYVVALHRFLRWRVAGYRPEDHLGGVGYLFLRGLTGPDVPLVDGDPCGVFHWQPSPALVVELSDLLATGGAR